MLCLLTAPAAGDFTGLPYAAMAAAQRTTQYTIRICHGGPNQRFRFDFVLPGAGRTHISNVHSGLCIVPTGY